MYLYWYVCVFMYVRMYVYKLVIKRKYIGYLFKVLTTTTQMLIQMLKV